MTVLAGWVRVRVGGVERDARPGEVVDVPPGTLHDYWDPGHEEAHVLVEVSPAARFEAMMVTLFGLAQEGRVSARGLPSLPQLAVLAGEFDDVVLFSSPPDPGPHPRPGFIHDHRWLQAERSPCAPV